MCCAALVHVLGTLKIYAKHMPRKLLACTASTCFAVQHRSPQHGIRSAPCRLAYSSAVGTLLTGTWVLRFHRPVHASITRRASSGVGMLNYQSLDFMKHFNRVCGRSHHRCCMVLVLVLCKGWPDHCSTCGLEPIFLRAK